MSISKEHREELVNYWTPAVR